MYRGPPASIATHITFMLLEAAWLDCSLARDAGEAWLVVFLEEGIRLSPSSLLVAIMAAYSPARP
jgi:hypothetical protein